MSQKWLSQVFGNEGVEKTAQSMWLQKLANEEGIDLSELTDEQVDLLAQQIAAEAEENAQALQGQDPQAGGQPQMQDPQQQVDPGMMAQQQGGDEAAEMQMKIAEADGLGRVMAHAMINEVEKIGQQQGQTPPAGPVESAIRNLGGSVQGGQEEVEKVASQVSGGILELWRRTHG